MSEEEVKNEGMEKRNVATSVRERTESSFDEGIEKAAGMFGGTEKRAASPDDSRFRKADEDAERP